MGRTYKATGINLKGAPLGEADRLLTILTPEYGLIRAVAPGARKHKSRLRGRSELFVVNQLLMVEGRSLDKISQAETVESYPGLSRDFGKLAAGQYLAELVLYLALSDQPQTELYDLFNEHLRRIAQLYEQTGLWAHLAQGMFHLLAIAGIGPQVHHCGLTQQVLSPHWQDPNWRVGFSFEVGGLVSLNAPKSKCLKPQQGTHRTNEATRSIRPPTRFPVRINTKLRAVEMTLLQQLGAHSLPDPVQILPSALTQTSLVNAWVNVERALRGYAQYHFGRKFRSASLLDTLTPVPLSTHQKSS